MFDASVLNSPCSPFEEMKSAYFTFMAGLKRLSDEAHPTITHEFLKFLKDRSKLLRVYTQNIDGLEYRVGLIADTNDKCVVDVHGTLNKLSCTLCQFEVPFKDSLLKAYEEGKGASCFQCEERSQTRVDLGKRPLAVGVLTPSILLYNDHPTSHSKSMNGKHRYNFTCGYKMSHLCDEIGHYMSMDAPRPNTPHNRKKVPDMVLVMGTSCKVVGIKKWIKTLSSLLHNPSLAQSVTETNPDGGRSLSQTPITKYLTPVSSPLERPRLLQKESARWVVYINRTSLPQKEWHSVFDLQIIGDSDPVCSYLQASLEESNRCKKDLFKQEKLSLKQVKSYDPHQQPKMPKGKQLPKDQDSKASLPPSSKAPKKPSKPQYSNENAVCVNSVS